MNYRNKNNCKVIYAARKFRFLADEDNEREKIDREENGKGKVDGEYSIALPITPNIHQLWRASFKTKSLSKFGCNFWFSRSSYRVLCSSVKRRSGTYKSAWETFHA